MSYYNPRDQYYNGNQSESYQEEYVGGYQQEQPARNYYNPQMQENNHFYSTQDLNTGTGTPADDNDNASVVSSIYSQPSVAGTSPSNNMQYYQGISNTMEPQSLSYNEPPFHHDDDPMDYPPSPLAASTNTHSSAVGLTTISTQQQSLPLYDQNEKNYIPNYTEENQYSDFSPNSQSQFDVYNDFNNNYRKDESYDEEETRNNTLTGSNGPNSYAMNIDSGTGKAARHSMTGEHFVVTPKKNRRCGFCTRKICVITTFVILVVLAAGMYFVWPRVPKIEIFPPIAVGDAEITLSPVAAKMQMELQIELDNRDNWLPYKFNSFDVDVFNAARISSFNREIATGNKKDFSIPGKAKSTISIPISIDYSGTEKNDPIVQDFISACTKPPEGGSKTPLNLRFDIKMFIWGLDWVSKPTISKPVSDFQCPFEAIPPSPDAPPPEEPAIEQPETPPEQPETPPEQPADPKVPDPAVPAKDPAVPPEDPAVPAKDPAAPPEDPAVPKDPAVPPEDPAVPAKDPAVPPEDPAVAKDPAAPPEDPAVPAKDPAVPPEQPDPAVPPPA